MADEMTAFPEPERGILPPPPPAPMPGRVEPETGIEPDDEVAAERVETFEGTQDGKDVGPAPSGA